MSSFAKFEEVFFLPGQTTERKDHVPQICILGLGYVGLPLALSFAMEGQPVIGVDTNRELIQQLKAGITYHKESFEGKSIQEILREQLEAGSFVPKEEVPSGCTIYIITVGIPVVKKEPFYEPLLQALRMVREVLKKGDLVLLRSTVPPGFSEQIARPLLEEKGLRAGIDFNLAYSSERIAEGKAFEEFRNMPVVVAGLSEECCRRAEKVLGLIARAPIYRASSMTAVETAKLFENISRDVNIAMVNEFAAFCRAVGLNTQEVISLANTHKRVNLLQPGPGVGGYCLPNALYYLLPRAREKELSLPLLTTARQVNDSIPASVSQMVFSALAAKGVSPAEAKIAVLGLAMKDYSSDDRQSPAWIIIRQLQERGVAVSIFDPAVPYEGPLKASSLEDCLRDSDCLLILARQKEIPFSSIPELLSLMKPKPVVIDTRFVFTKEEISQRGGVYYSL